MEDTQAKRMTAEFSKEKLDAIFHHPDCKELFEDKVAQYRLPVSIDGTLIINSFAKFVHELTNEQINATTEGFEQMVHMLSLPTDGDIFPCHTGVFMLMIKHINHIAGHYYSDTIDERHAVRTACDNIEKQIMAAVDPIRLEAIEEFYMSANAEQIDEINDKAAKIEQYNKQQGAGNTIPMPPPQITIN